MSISQQIRLTLPHSAQFAEIARKLVQESALVTSPCRLRSVTVRAPWNSSQAPLSAGVRRSRIPLPRLIEAHSERRFAGL